MWIGSVCRLKIGDTDVQVRREYTLVMAIRRAFSYARGSLWLLCMGDLRVCRVTPPVLHTYAQLPPLSKCERNGVGFFNWSKTE